MKLLQHLAKNYPCSCFYIVFIWILCFMDVPETPLDDVSFIDKWTHLVMYGGTCGTIWYEYLHHHTELSWRRLFVFAWLLPVLMSGLIEFLQATCTGGRRSGDWLDFAANAVGATLGAAIGMLLVWRRARADRGS